MVVDSSALLAILLDEPERDLFVRLTVEGKPARLSAASLVESSIVIESRRGQRGGADLDRFLRRAGLVVAPVDHRQAEIARTAFRRFGKGRHPAGLNFGDCFAYALARATGEPLLFKGDDFARTDVEPAWSP